MGISKTEILHRSLAVTGLSSVLLGLLWIIITSLNLYFGTVRQEVGGRYVSTYAWYKINIVASWHDDRDSISDSIIALRKHQGDSVLQVVKKIKL